MHEPISEEEKLIEELEPIEVLKNGLVKGGEKAQKVLERFIDNTEEKLTDKIKTLFKCGDASKSLPPVEHVEKYYQGEGKRAELSDAERTAVENLSVMELAVYMADVDTFIKLYDDWVNNLNDLDPEEKSSIDKRLRECLLKRNDDMFFLYYYSNSLPILVNKFEEYLVKLKEQLDTFSEVVSGNNAYFPKELISLIQGKTTGIKRKILLSALEKTVAYQFVTAKKLYGNIINDSRKAARLMNLIVNPDGPYNVRGENAKKFFVALNEYMKKPNLVGNKTKLQKEIKDQGLSYNPDDKRKRKICMRIFFCGKLLLVISIAAAIVGFITLFTTSFSSGLQLFIPGPFVSVVAFVWYFDNAYTIKNNVKYELDWLLRYPEKINTDAGVLDRTEDHQPLLGNHDEAESANPVSTASSANRFNFFSKCFGKGSSCKDGAAMDGYFSLSPGR